MPAVQYHQECKDEAMCSIIQECAAGCGENHGNFDGAQDGVNDPYARSNVRRLSQRESQPELVEKTQIKEETTTAAVEGVYEVTSDDNQYAVRPINTPVQPVDQPDQAIAETADGKKETTAGKKRKRELEPDEDDLRPIIAKQRRIYNAAWERLFQKDMFPDSRQRGACHDMWNRLSGAIGDVIGTPFAYSASPIDHELCLFGCNGVMDGAVAALNAFFHDILEGQSGEDAALNLVEALCCEHCIEEDEDRARFFLALCVCAGIAMTKSEMDRCRVVTLTRCQNPAQVEQSQDRQVRLSKNLRGFMDQQHRVQQMQAADNGLIDLLLALV